MRVDRRGYGQRRSWPWRWLVRASRASRRPRARVIVTGRPYDWELDGFGDDLYGPPARMPKPQVAVHVDTDGCYPYSVAYCRDDDDATVLDYERKTSIYRTGDDDE